MQASSKRSVIIGEQADGVSLLLDMEQIVTKEVKSRYV